MVVREEHCLTHLVRYDPEKEDPLHTEYAVAADYSIPIFVYTHPQRIPGSLRYRRD